jgi:hypothetical protein
VGDPVHVRLVRTHFPFRNAWADDCGDGFAFEHREWFWQRGIVRSVKLVPVLNGALRMKRSLIALGWLRDVVLVLLLAAGNSIRHTSPVAGTAIMVSAIVIFAERFLWSWLLLDLRDLQAASSSSKNPSPN